MAGSSNIVISQGNSLFEEEGESLISHAPVEIGDTRILLETIRLRCLIESEAARLAAVNRTTGDIKEIQGTLFDSINEIRCRHLPKGYIKTPNCPNSEENISFP